MLQQLLLLLTVFSEQSLERGAYICHVLLQLIIANCCQRCVMQIHDGADMFDIQCSIHHRSVWRICRRDSILDGILLYCCASVSLWVVIDVAWTPHVDVMQCSAVCGVAGRHCCWLIDTCTCSSSSGVTASQSVGFIDSCRARCVCVCVCALITTLSLLSGEAPTLLLHRDTVGTEQLNRDLMNNRRSDCRRTTRRAVSVQILSNASQLYKKSHLKGLQ